MEDGLIRDDGKGRPCGTMLRNMSPQRRLVLGLAAAAVVGALLVGVALNPRVGYSTPEGCSLMGQDGYYSQDGQQRLPYDLQDCRGRSNDGPKILILDDLLGTGASKTTGGHSWAGPSGVGGYEYGQAMLADGTLFYKYQFILGNGDGTGGRAAHFTFLENSDLAFDVVSDTALLISARTGVVSIQLVEVDLSQVTQDAIFYRSSSSPVHDIMDDNADIAAFVANVLAMYDQENANADDEGSN